MDFERNISNVGGSVGIIIPHDVCQFLNLTVGLPVILRVEHGKHGKFISIWRKDQKEYENLKIGENDNDTERTSDC